MNTYWTYIALDIANDRSREADRHRLAALAREGFPASPGVVRRTTARALASISRGAATIVRRLDDCVADDLAESFAPGR